MSHTEKKGEDSGLKIQKDTCSPKALMATVSIHGSIEPGSTEPPSNGQGTQKLEQKLRQIVYSDQKLIHTGWIWVWEGECFIQLLPKDLDITELVLETLLT